MTKKRVQEEQRPSCVFLCLKVRRVRGRKEDRGATTVSLSTITSLHRRYFTARVDPGSKHMSAPRRRPSHDINDDLRLH